MPPASSNRLAQESSPYLLLHAHNPVDWYPWGEEALARARAEDRPIFLSVGYSTCYWCHVMERESFSQPAVAALMNSELINIKVDREERPDLDEIYMAATQFLAEQGGWPNSVFLTPELKPFFAGTYFPPEDRHGRPGFPALVQAVAEAWDSRRGEIEAQAEEVTRAIRRYLEERVGKGTRLPAADVGRRSLAALERRFDPVAGGFGGAPKFPTPSNLFLLLDLAAATPRAGEMLALTLDRMARGGIYDQLAGGFHRYSTDREWQIPHFEKMLYDNGLLLEIYAREFQRSGEPEAARIARETAAFLERELSGPDGEFWSALDAETGGHEGAYYVWTRAELLAALGADDAVFLRSLWGFDGPPFFEQDRYVLHLPRPLDEQAAVRRMSREQLLAQMAPGRARLLEARERRPRPATDDKVLADWNGMAIAGFAVAGRALGEPALVERAVRAARFALERLRAGGALQHVWRGGEARIPAFLADFAFLIRGLLRLAEADSDPLWAQSAVALQAELDERLGDPEGGYFSAGASPDLLFRSKEVFDGAVPAANAIAVLNLLDLQQTTGEDRYGERAEAALRVFAPTIEAQVEGARMMAIAVRRVLGDAPAGAEAPAAPALPLAAALESEARRVVQPALEVAPGPRGEWRRFRLHATVAKGWHVHANPAEEGFVATAVEAEGAELRALEYPPPSAAARALELAIYDSEFEITGELRADSPRAALRLSYQACDDRRCLPAVAVELPV